MKKEMIVSLVLVLLFLVSVFPANIYSRAAPVDDWPMFHHDLTHTGYSTSPALTTNQTLWNYTTGNQVQSSPAVANGIVYVGSDDGNLYAFNATSSALIWSYTTGKSISSSPTVANGVVYVGSLDDKVYAFDATTGALVWNYTTNAFVDSSPAVAGGIVYVGSDYPDDNLYALNATTGAIVWSYTTGDQVSSSPAIDNGVVYVGSYDGNLYAIGSILSVVPEFSGTLPGITLVISIFIALSAVIIAKKKKNPEKLTMYLN